MNATVLTRAGKVTLLWLCPVALLSAGGGYLPAAGPGPLRFKTPIVATLRLPPLAPPPQPAALAKASEPATSPGSTPPPTAPAVPPTATPPEATTTTAQPPATAYSGTEPPLVTPQSLIPFFLTLTNRGGLPETSLILPTAFLPPGSAEPRSSTAVYLTNYPPASNSRK